MRLIDFRSDILPLKNKLYRLALRITLDSAEAEDIVQETMIRVWKQQEELAQIESIEAFCMTICRNLAIDRHERKEAQNVQLDEALHDRAGQASPHEDLEQNEKLRIVKKLFDQLPPKQREVMQLRDIEGYSYKDISDILGQTEEQVKVNLFRARQRIREQYKNIENYGL